MEQDTVEYNIPHEDMGVVGDEITLSTDLTESYDLDPVQAFILDEEHCDVAQMIIISQTIIDSLVFPSILHRELFK